MVAETGGYPFPLTKIPIRSWPNLKLLRRRQTKKSQRYDLTVYEIVNVLLPGMFEEHQEILASFNNTRKGHASQTVRR